MRLTLLLLFLSVAISSAQKPQPFCKGYSLNYASNYNTEDGQTIQYQQNEFQDPFRFHAHYTSPNKYHFASYLVDPNGDYRVIDSLTVFSNNLKINSENFPVLRNDSIQFTRRFYLTPVTIFKEGEKCLVKPSRDYLFIRRGDDQNVQMVFYK